MAPDTLAAICVVAAAVLNPEDIGRQRGITGLPAVGARDQVASLVLATSTRLGSMAKR